MNQTILNYYTYIPTYLPIKFEYEYLVKIASIKNYIYLFLSFELLKQKTNIYVT